MTSAFGTWDAIIVAGGRASRLGGIDKPALIFDGRSLIQRSLGAVNRASNVAIVGYRGDVARLPRIHRVDEQPRWSGPAAAITAGLRCLALSDSQFTAVIAADLPLVASALPVLLDSLDSLDTTIADGVIAVDASSERQPLLAIYRTDSIRRAAGAFPDTGNLSVRRLIGLLTLRELPLSDALCADVDTPEDAAALGIELPEKPTQTERP